VGVFTGARRASLPLDDEGVAWVRLTSACDLSCRFCLDADRLDGSIRSFEDVAAELDQVAAKGSDRVVLSGGEPTKSPHLLRIVRHAKALDLTVSLTTNGMLLAAAKPCEMLAAAGLDEVRISLHSGVRSTHDLVVGHHGAWVRSLSALRHAASAGLVVTLHMVLHADNLIDVAHLVHLAAMAGVRRARVYHLRPEGRGAREGAEIAVEDGVALGLLDRLWRAGVDEGVQLDAVGFEALAPDAPQAPDPSFAPPPMDAGGLGMLRKGVVLASTRSGCTARDADGKWGGFLRLAGDEEGLAALCATLRDLGSPVLDMPRCVGGRGEADPSTVGAYVAACEACPERGACAGVAALVARKAGDQLGWPS